MASGKQKRKGTKHISKLLHNILINLKYILKIMQVLKSIFELFH